MKNAYLQKVYNEVLARDPDAPELHQTIREFLDSLEGIVDKHPEWEENGILERFVEPDRVIIFRVTWVDDAGNVRHRPLQGRDPVPSQREPVRDEVPGL